MWRPDEWDKIAEEEYYHFGGDREIYEQGADAMLEALFKLAENSPTKTFTIDAHKAQIYLGSESDETP